MIPLGPVVARSRLRAARSVAWIYLADESRRAEWWPELRLDPWVGGVVAERWTEETGETSVSRDASGAVDVWVDGHAIGFTWREAGDVRDTAVLLTLRSQGAETGITVTETGFDALPNAADRAAASQDGWQVLLRDLALAIEAAADAGQLPVAPEAPAPAAAAVEAVGGSAAGSADEAAGTAAVPGSGAPEAAVPEPESADSVSAGVEGVEAAAAEAAGAEGAAPASPDDETGMDDDLNDTVRVERLVTPAAAPEGAGDAAHGAHAASGATAAGEAADAEAADADAASETGDPDFDALIRGDNLER